MKQPVKHKMLSLGFALIFLSGCSTAPNKSAIEETITKHFKAQGYNVIDLKIGDISPIPISAKTYMGKPGYMIDLPSLTLQPVPIKEYTGNYRKEEKITFSNAHIYIQQGNGPDKRWIITNMSGINAP